MGESGEWIGYDLFMVRILERRSACFCFWKGSYYPFILQVFNAFSYSVLAQPSTVVNVSSERISEYSSNL
jgi:hypothetical protein